jgi:hypothetical protein
MKEITVLGQPLILQGDENSIDGEFEHPIFAQKAIIGFKNYDSETPENLPSAQQIAQLEHFLENFSENQQEFLNAVRQYLLEQPNEYFDNEEMQMILENENNDLSEYFQNPFIKIETQQQMVFGYYESTFDVEYGIAAAYNGNEITEIAGAGDLA